MARMLAQALVLSNVSWYIVKLSIVYLCIATTTAQPTTSTAQQTTTQSGSTTTQAGSTTQGPTTTTAVGSTTESTPSNCTNERYDYGKVLELSNLFYEAQRSGDLPDNNRVPWRGDSSLGDKGANGEDLTGGYHDGRLTIKLRRS